MGATHNITIGGSGERWVVTCSCGKFRRGAKSREAAYKLRHQHLTGVK